MDELLRLPTEKLLEKFGAGSHKPGSGSAAALIALISCKMLRTVVLLTDGKERYEGVREQLTLINQEMEESIDPYLVSAIQEDSEVFNRVINLREQRNLSKVNSDERKRLNAKSLRELEKATEIPLEIADHAVKLVTKALDAFDLGFQAARGDSGVAISAALSALSSSLAIIYLNLISFRGSDWAIETRHRADELFDKCKNLQNELFIRIERLRQEAINRETSKK